MARFTDVPASSIDSNSATGVTAPERPTWKIIFLNLVAFSSAGYLTAIAHLGALLVAPNRFCISNLSIFTTMPSVA